MKQVWHIFVKEWKSFLYTPIAMLIVPFYLVLTGLYFYSSVYNFTSMVNPSEFGATVRGVNVTQHLVIRYVSQLFNIFIFIVPLITMRSFSEEKRQGTYELLISYPIKPANLVLGKFFASLSMLFFLLFLSFAYVLVIIFQSDVFLPQVLSGFAGYALFLILYCAWGILISVLTENQLIAALFTFGFYLAGYLFSWLAFVSGEPFDKIFINYFFTMPVGSFRNGIIFLGDVAMYISLSVILIDLAIWKVKRHYIWN